MIQQNKENDSRIERKIITAMITSARFLKEIQPIYDRTLLATSFTRTVGDWCQEYFAQYEKAPGIHIQDIYDGHSANGLDPDQSDLIGAFLESISEEFEQAEKLNVFYLLDQAEKYLRKRSLSDLNRQIKVSLSTNDLNAAEAALGGYKRLSRPQSEAVNPLTDQKLIESAFDNENSGNVLFSLPGDLGRAIGPLERGFLLAILAQQKRGKTWELQDIAVRSLLSGFNTLFVSMEMTKQQITKRIHSQLSGLPTIERFAGSILIPVFDCEDNQDDSCTKPTRVSKVGVLDEKGNRPEYIDADEDYVACSVCRGRREFKPCSWFVQRNRELLTAEIAKDRGRIVSSGLRGNQLKVLFYPPGSVTVEQLETELFNLEYYEDFIPDTIVIDYADKFKLPKGEAFRHKIGEIWTALKGWAIAKHCLVVTASQSNTARTGRDLKQGDWAEAIEKLALVDIAIGLNQNEEEKRAGVIRVPILAQRHDDFDLQQEVMVLQQFKIGKPYLDSYLRRR